MRLRRAGMVHSRDLQIEISGGRQGIHEHFWHGDLR
jgi:hypothetical protein